MDIGIRLKSIAAMVDSCSKIADIGSDHAYIPIFLVKNRICQNAIASDIHKGPIEKAKRNVQLENLEDKIECRLGGGFTTIAPQEVNVAIIAGMGGNLIRDIIEEKMSVFKSLQYAILQPVQNPEILREYIYKKGYTIIDEELCFEEGKYYEIIKVCYSEKPIEVDPIYYEIGEKLIQKKHPLLEAYLRFKLDRYRKIYYNIIEETDSAKLRKIELEKNIFHLEELLQCH